MTEPTPRISRRSLLVLLAAVPAVVAGGFAYARRRQLRLLVDKLRHNANPYRLDAGSGTGDLAVNELENLLALAQVLIPWQGGGETVRAVTRELIEDQCQTEAGARQSYADASRLLDEESGGERFAALAPDRQQQVVASLMPPAIRSRRDWRHVYNILFRYEETRLAELVATDILDNFYRDERSWPYLQERSV